MSRLIINGGKKLKGVWRLSGNKNEALPLVAAALLFENGLTLTNFPEIEDSAVMLAIAALAKKMVYQRFGIELEEEVRILDN